MSRIKLNSKFIIGYLTCWCCSNINISVVYITIFRFSINKKMKKVAIKSALSAKYAAYEIYVVEDLAVEEIKTAKMAALLKGLEVDKKALIVTAEADEKVYKSARNIKGVTVSHVGTLNTYDVLNNHALILSKDAVAKIEEVLAY